MKSWSIGFLMIFSAQVLALSARDLVSDAEHLYAQLGPREAERAAVALRLADLKFDAALEIDADAKATAKDGQLAESYRRQARRLYEEQLPSLRAGSLTRVKFQLARLYALDGKMPEAIKSWKDLVRTSTDAHLRRESALHVAEQLELSNRPDAIAEAGRLYAMALPLSEKRSLQSYVLYRQAWTQFRLGQTDPAVLTLQKSLLLADGGREREDLLKDLVLFLSRQNQPASRQIALLEKLERQEKRTGLVASLGEAYATADRPADYVTVLKALNDKQETIERDIALLDATHDTLSPSAILTSLRQIQKRSGEAFASADTEKKSRDRLYRLVLLWDGQRRVQPETFDPLFGAGVDTMTQLFPESEEAQKAIAGWLSVHKDPDVQLAQLERWLKVRKGQAPTNLDNRLHQNRLELARQLKRWDMVVAESKLLEAVRPSREARYQRAKALYELKNHDEALPLFLQLAGADEIGRFSQDLALDIYAQRKSYADIVRQTEAWKTTGARGQELSSLGEKARFEWAVERQDETSLSEFTSFCLNKKFMPKSCENARSLAARLRNSDQLVTVLRAQGDEVELARQLEVSGRFGESARVLERRAQTHMDILKVALLFELQGELKERNRVLEKFSRDLIRQQPQISASEQNLIFETLSDAGLVSESSLRLPLTPELKTKVALRLADKSESARRMVMASCEGPADQTWQKIHLAQIREHYERQRKINFTGKQSKSRFEARVKELKNLGREADCFMKGAPSEVGLSVAARVADAYQEFADQIHATEIPEGLDEETKAQVEAQIEAMAQPFAQSAEQWRTAARSHAADREWNFVPSAEPSMPTQLRFDWQPWLEAIRKAPYARGPQEELAEHFKVLQAPRLAAYMNGRLESLEKQ